MNIRLKNILTAICFGSLLLLGAPSVSAPTQNETAKLLASDGAGGDRFGESVAISGDTAVIGVHEDDDNGGGSGAAYLFVRSGGIWTQQAKLLPSDGAAGDEFGISVAVSGNTAVIGVRAHSFKRAAYVFDLTGATGTVYEIAKLLPSDGAPPNGFGRSVAISGTTAVIGAHGEHANGPNFGSAYVFDLNAATGVVHEIAKLLPSDSAAPSGFGVSVAISGTRALIGANDWFSGGAAYAFDLTSATGIVYEVAKLLASDGVHDDSFGTAVAVSGNTAIVGASLDGDNGYMSGSAYAFDLTSATGIVYEVAKLLPSDGDAMDYFGRSVTVSGTTAVIGADGDEDNGYAAGSAYLFDLTGATGTLHETSKLLPSESAPTPSGLGFGVSVAISGTAAVIGAPYYDRDMGSAYIFDFIVDEDGDGVVDDDDFCTDTAIPETVPTVRLLPNRWALMDDDSEFDTVIQGNGNGPNRSYIIEDTAGCSCEQIIEAQGLGLGHTYHGCSISAMDEWVELVTP